MYPEIHLYCETDTNDMDNSDTLFVPRTLVYINTGFTDIMGFKEIDSNTVRDADTSFVHEKWKYWLYEH